MASSATRTALINEIKMDLSDWNINLSQSQFNAFISHIEAIINSNSATIVADVASDLGIWPEPPHGRHS